MHCTIISAEFKFGGRRLPGCAPSKSGVQLRSWENQHRLSSFWFLFFPVVRVRVIRHLYSALLWNEPIPIEC